MVVAGVVQVQAHVLGYLENYSLVPFTCFIIALLHTWRQRMNWYRLVLGYLEMMNGGGWGGTGSCFGIPGELKFSTLHLLHNFPVIYLETTNSGPGDDEWWWWYRYRLMFWDTSGWR